MREKVCLLFNHVKNYVPINPFPAEWVLRALIDFTLSSARRFYSSMGNPLDGKGLILYSIRADEWLSYFSVQIKIELA